MTALSAVIFDLDGTLIDSVPDIAAALNRCLLAEGRAALADAEVARLVGGGARELVARALGPTAPPDDVESVHAQFLANYAAEPVLRTRLYPYARELLDNLRVTGLPLAICTNKPQALTDQILDRLEIARFFRVVWGAASGRPLKPDAACLESVCDALKTPTSASVMVGDSHADIKAAHAAGCPSILVGHGYEQRPLAELGANVLVADLLQAGRVLATWTADGVSPLHIRGRRLS